MDEIIQWTNKHAGLISGVNTIMVVVLGVLGIFFNRSLERLKAHLNAKFHAHTLLYEKELEILGGQWIAAVNFRDAVTWLNPTLTPSTLGGPAQADEDRTEEGLVNCRETLNAFYTVIDHNRPFFPQGIREAAEKVIKLGKEEAAYNEQRLRSSPSDRAAQFEQSQQRRATISNSIDRIEEIIRNRVKELTA
jgi:hypothetical protein